MDFCSDSCIFVLIAKKNLPNRDGYLGKRPLLRCHRHEGSCSIAMYIYGVKVGGDDGVGSSLHSHSSSLNKVFFIIRINSTEKFHLRHFPYSIFLISLSTFFFSTFSCFFFRYFPSNPYFLLDQMISR